MCNWLEKGAVIEKIQDRITLKENFIKVCNSKQKEYKDVFNTFDKFEAKYNEYWRVQELCAMQEITFLKELLTEINEEKLEEIKILEEAEEDNRINRADSYI